MNTREILSTLLEVSKSLEDQNYVREADKVHNLMIRVSQVQQAPASYIRAPYKSTYKDKGFWGNVGDALGNAGKAIGNVAIQGAKAVGDAANTVGNAALNVAKSPVNFINKNIEMEKDLERSKKQSQMQYYLNSLQKNILDYATNQLRANPSLTIEQARQNAKNELYNNQNYRNLYNQFYQTYKVPIDQNLVTRFDLYVKPGIINERVFGQKNKPAGTYFGADGNLRAVEKVDNEGFVESSAYYKQPKIKMTNPPGT